MATKPPWTLITEHAVFKNKPQFMKSTDPNFCSRHGVCPACCKPWQPAHAYLVEPETCLSRLTTAVPMHYLCAKELMGGLSKDQIHILWVVRSSSKEVPTFKYFDTLDGENRIQRQLFSPTRIEFWLNGKFATYDQIYEHMEPALIAARDRATTADEITSLTQQIAWLHRYLPPAPKSDLKHQL